MVVLEKRMRHDFRICKSKKRNKKKINLFKEKRLFNKTLVTIAKLFVKNTKSKIFFSFLFVELLLKIRNDIGELLHQI
jgi:hypothetical protein